MGKRPSPMHPHDPDDPCEPHAVREPVSRSRQPARAVRTAVVSSTRPARPRWLTPQARRVWDKVVPQLDAMGVLERIDGPALSRYCELSARWLATVEFLNRYCDTWIIKDAAGKPRFFMAWPQLNSLIKLTAALGRLEQEFGMTPSSRSRIRVERQAALEPGPRRSIAFPRGSSRQRLVRPALGAPSVVDRDDDGDDFFDGGGPAPPRVPPVRSGSEKTPDMRSVARPGIPPPRGAGR